VILSPSFKVPLRAAYLTGRHEADAGPRKLPRPLSTPRVAEAFGLSLARWRIRPGLTRLLIACRQAAIGADPNIKKENHHDRQPHIQIPPPRALSHLVYSVRDREAKKAVWTRIGAAWEHADNKGFSIQIEALPLDGRITLRLASEKKE
jgi:hypothetical protein